MYFQSLIDRLDQALLVSQHLTMNIQKHKHKLLSEDRIMMVTLIFLNESNKYIDEYSCEIDVIYRSIYPVER